MTLTVPKAGVVAGRSASPRIVASDTGAAIADFGQVMMGVGTAMENDRLEREMARSRVDMMEGLNSLRLEFEQIGDPDVIDRDFKPRTDELRDRLFETMDPKNRIDAMIMFDELRVPHSAALGVRAVEQRQSQQMATLMRTTDTVVRTAATADPQTQATYQAQLDDHLDHLVSIGVLTPEEAEVRRWQAGADMEAARATRLLSDDPARLIAAIDAGEFGRMDPTQAQKFRAQASSAERAATAAVMSEVSRAEKERISVAKDTLAEGIAVMRKGRAWSGMMGAESLLSDPAIAALPEAREFAYTAVLFEQKPEFAVLPMTEKKRLLAEAEAQPIGEAFEADLVEAMRAQIAADEAGFATNRFAYAAEIGLKPAPDLPDPQNATPDELIAGLRDRHRYSQSLQQSGFVKDVVLFAPDEKDAWARLVTPDKSPADRARIAGVLSVAFGTGAENAAAELGADPLFSYVGGLLAHGGTETLARQVFDGQRAIDAQDVKMPGVAERRQEFFVNFTSLFEDGTRVEFGDDTPQRDQIIAAADALYAYRARGNADYSDGQMKESAYLQAVHEVMGGSGSYETRDARGGIQDVLGHLTLMPPGVAGDDIEAALDFMQSAGKNASLAKGLWQKISMAGNVPAVGGEPIDRGTWPHLRLRAVDQSAYEIQVFNPATERFEAIWGDDGQPFYLNVDTLLTKIGGTR